MNAFWEALFSAKFLMADKALFLKFVLVIFAHANNCLVSGGLVIDNRAHNHACMMYKPSNDVRTTLRSLALLGVNHCLIHSTHLFLSQRLVGRGNPCFKMHDLCGVSEGKCERLGDLSCRRWRSDLECAFRRLGYYAFYSIRHICAYDGNNHEQVE